MPGRNALQIVFPHFLDEFGRYESGQQQWQKLETEAGHSANSTFNFFLHCSNGHDFWANDTHAYSSPKEKLSVVPSDTQFSNLSKLLKGLFCSQPNQCVQNTHGLNCFEQTPFRVKSWFFCITLNMFLSLNRGFWTEKKYSFLY